MTRFTWLVLAAACGTAEQVEVDALGESVVDEAEVELADRIEQDFARYVRALVADDVAGVEGLVSGEVLARGEQRGIPFPRFVQKQRDAMKTTFTLDDGAVPTFEVADLAIEGDAVRVTFSLDGEDLAKPWYYVFEDGEPKLNIARPGFSVQAPDGAEFGRESYLIQNDEWYGNPATTMTCDGGSKTVDPRTSGTVSCNDNCGWWAGTRFMEYYDPNGTIRYCDWNSWGADVVIDYWLLGWYCVDYC